MRRRRWLSVKRDKQRPYSLRVSEAHIRDFVQTFVAYAFFRGN
jgi:hypothetical protein